MKNLLKILSVVLCFTLFATFLTGCDDTNLAADNSKDDKIQAEQDKKLSFLHSGTDENSDYPSIVAMKKFEEQYKRDIEFITCGYDEWNQKVMASIASGDPIDVVNAGDSEYPYLAMKGYTMPIDEYINLDSEYLQLSIMKELFSYKGKYYNASPKGAGSPLLIYYNKDLITSEGFDDPYELYLEDNWTTEKMKDMCMKFTQDTNGDGKYDRWGLAAWYRWAFMGSSAASVCSINNEGKFELNLDNNPALLEAFELIRSAWSTDNWLGVEGGDIYSSFYTQRNLMINEFSWAGKKILEAKNQGLFSFDVGCVPFPYGKSNTEKANPCFADGFSILNGSDAPYSAGKLIEMVLEELVKKGEETKDAIPKEWQDLYTKLVEKPFNSRYYDSAINGGADICDKISSGTVIAQAIEMFKPKYQALVDDANKEPVVKKDYEFKSINVDFSKGLNGFKKASETNSLDISQDGDALKISMNTDVYNDICIALETDPNVYPIYGFKKYKVTFDYKVEKIPNAELTYYGFKLFRNGTDFNDNIFVPDPGSVGNYIQGEVEIEGVADSSEDLKLQIIGYYANTLWIKNLKIEEIK